MCSYLRHHFHHKIHHDFLGDAASLGLLDRKQVLLAEKKMNKSNNKKQKKAKNSFDFFVLKFRKAKKAKKAKNIYSSFEKKNN